MRFRLTALGVNLLASIGALTAIFGVLYFGWYRWPGWYLADVSQLIVVIAGVALVVGPLLTFMVASTGKARRVFARDVAVIVVIQLAALLYGAMSIWNGRPLYYAFSETVLQIIQAYDINSQEGSLSRAQKSEFAPHWYNLPRWIWAPLPEDPKEHDRVLKSATSGGEDVISMPRYFKKWDAGLPALRTQLKKVDDVGYFSGAEKQLLKERMRASGLATDQMNSIALLGRGRPLLAVFDPATATLRALIKPK